LLKSCVNKDNNVIIEKNDKNIDEYLEKIKSKTKIIILLPEFDWNGKEVIMKK